jgi:N-acetylglucosaminyldiphosphoundecaprenol N-acetyl-beta-D-mannosaminyltransferase
VLNINFQGIPIYAGGIRRLPYQIKKLFELNRPVRIHLCNAYTISLATLNEDYRKILLNADLNIPDGRPLALCLSASENLQIRGMDLFNLIIADPEFRSMKHLFYGVGPEKLSLFEQFLSKTFSDTHQFRVVVAPYVTFEKLELENLRLALEIFEADFIWIGLGTPKQDFAVDAISLIVKKTCAVIPVGAVFDFVIGNSIQAPKLIRKFGFEWLYRWAREPRRLASRYSIHNLIFLSQVFKHLFKKFYLRIN